MAKILLVEDDVDLAAMISARLEAENHVVEVAHDGKVGYDYMMITKYERTCSSNQSFSKTPRSYCIRGFYFRRSLAGHCQPPTDKKR